MVEQRETASSLQPPNGTQGLVRSTAGPLMLAQRARSAVGLARLMQQEATASYWFERGRTAEVAQQWPETVHAYRQCVERDARHWRGGVRLAAALGQLGHAEAAAVALTQASEVAFEGHTMLVAELDKNGWQTLRTRMEETRSSAQDGFGLLLGLALVYIALESFAQARQTMDVMRFMFENKVAQSAIWFRFSGRIALCENSYDEAIKDYDQAILLMPDNALYYHYRSNAKYEYEEVLESIADYDRAIELKPDYALAYLRRGFAKDSLAGDDNWALADFDRAVELQPDARMYIFRAEYKVSRDDHAGAIADFDCAIELKVDDANLYSSRADAKAKLADYTGAIADYDRTVELEPHDAWRYISRGLYKGKLAEYAGAIADYDRAIELSPGLYTFHLWRADLKEKLRDMAGAAADREIAARLKS